MGSAADQAPPPSISKSDLLSDSTRGTVLGKWSMRSLENGTKQRCNVASPETLLSSSSGRVVIPCDDAVQTTRPQHDQKLAPARPALPSSNAQDLVAGLTVDPYSDENRLVLDDAVNANLVLAGVHNRMGEMPDEFEAEPACRARRIADADLQTGQAPHPAS
jgi:hypothetical protein